MKKPASILNFAWLSPILFAAFPILALWQFNFALMDAIDVLRPLLEALLAAVILYFLFKLIFRDATKAGLLSALILILFFSYGQIYAALRLLPGIGVFVARHRILGPFWAMILVAGGFLILKFGSRLSGLTLFLNSTGAVLLVLVGVRLGYSQYKLSVLTSPQIVDSINTSSGLKNKSVADQSIPPDIYMILVDTYARSDVLMNSFNYDNQPFVQALTKLGFVVPRCSMSNYAYTAFSMSSMFNMNYLEAFFPNLDPKGTGKNFSDFGDYIQHSQVRQNLTALGYRTISFESDYNWTEIKDADIFYKAEIPQSAMVDFFSHSDFDDELNDTSLIKILTDTEEVSPGLSEEMSRLDISFNALITKLFTLKNNKYYRIMSALDRLESLPQVRGPKFAYLHINALHPPYILSPKGQYQATNSISGYKNSLTYMNSRMLQILPRLIQDSRVPPIIILMGDHGIDPGKDIRLNNFEAIYLPGAGKQAIYPSITPVNIFRVIFNTQFNGSYPLLKDTSYNFVADHRQDFYAIPPNCPK
jgi:hypothetical protein